jgi:hypothetical protein
MPDALTIDRLWNSVTSGEPTFRPDQISGLPDAARHYLEHAIAAGTKLASAVRLRMHGEIKLRRWLPFTADQIILRDRGMIWNAMVRVYVMPVRGFDRLVDGNGVMRWKLFGIIPVMTASGPDITRSAAGRVGSEYVWLPSALTGNNVSWEAPDSSHATASFTVHGEKVELELTVDETGRLQALKLLRWGNPEGADFRYVDFGGAVEKEDRIGGYTIPTRLRAGWYFGSDRFESDGEFFRVTIDDATFR